MKNFKLVLHGMNEVPDYYKNGPRKYTSEMGEKRDIVNSISSSSSESDALVRSKQTHMNSREVVDENILDLNSNEDNEVKSLFNRLFGSSSRLDSIESNY